ncbi:GNAT family N-acetyltransferase [Bacillus spongiae]|uniref:GNAT family N-acetyltransferase n=1 Tax=Bacillus spongiae TaxID=2683610 RepID=A0ABU8HJT3_9BACI
MITLMEMNEIEFKKYVDFMIPEYAREVVKNFDLTMEQALEESKMMIDGLFTDGLCTSGQYLFTIRDANSNEKIGILWYQLNTETKRAFLNHIYIDEPNRGKGYGYKTLEKFQHNLKEADIKSIGLSVFESNDDAYRIYKKLGYSTTRKDMEIIL